MTETKQQEHDRLLRRTEELREEHASLGLDKKPFDQAEHNEHNKHLAQHRSDLAEHRKP
jgi:hypothetical protein